MEGVRGNRRIGGVSVSESDCECLDVHGLLLRCQQTVHGCRHRLHVDLQQEEEGVRKFKAAEVVTQKTQGVSRN